MDSASFKPLMVARREGKFGSPGKGQFEAMTGGYQAKRVLTLFSGRYPCTCSKRSIHPACLQTLTDLIEPSIAQLQHRNFSLSCNFSIVRQVPQKRPDPQHFRSESNTAFPRGQITAHPTLTLHSHVAPMAHPPFIHQRRLELTHQITAQ
jgi:hypothetical protein